MSAKSATHQRFLSGASKDLKNFTFRQPGRGVSDEEARDTAEPHAPTDDERVREYADERLRWGA